jgi:hypothetical protein
MTATRLTAVVFVAIVLAGCGQSPSRPASTATPLLATSSPREEAETLGRQGDWAGAVVKYREALRGAPDDLQLRFALGSALSHLERRDEAAEQFRWVVEHGRPSASEVSMARQWLLEADAANVPAEAQRATTAAKVDPSSTGKLQGKTTWPGISPDSFRLTLQVLLVGDDEANRGRILQVRTRLGEPYAFASVPEGQYRLSAQVGAVRLWDAPVSVSAGKATVLDLTPERSPVSPSDFPQREAR